MMRRKHKYTLLMSSILAIMPLAACTEPPNVPPVSLTQPPVTITPASATPISSKAVLTPLAATSILSTATASTAGTPPLVEAEKVIGFETDTLRLELTSNGRIQGIVDKTTGVNHADSFGSQLFPFMVAIHENQSLYPNAMWLENDQLVVKLGVTPQLTITLRVEHFDHFLTFEVVEFQGPPASPIRFVQLPVDLAEAETSKGYASVGNASFAVYILALDDQTEVHANAGRGKGTIAADVWQPSQIKGAKVAVFAIPQKSHRRPMWRRQMRPLFY